MQSIYEKTRKLRKTEKDMSYVGGVRYQGGSGSL